MQERAFIKKNKILKRKGGKKKNARKLGVAGV
jgi:hypothetical protein